MSGNGRARYRLIEHPGAARDIEEMATYIRRQSDLETADGWTLRLRAFLQDLGWMPAKFPVVAPPPPRAVHRTHFERKRLVYYDIFEAERAVRILYVWHGRRGDRPDLRRRHDPLVP